MNLFQETIYYRGWGTSHPGMPDSGNEEILQYDNAYNWTLWKVQLVALGRATPTSRWSSCSREKYIASTVRHSDSFDFVMHVTWSHEISVWSTRTRGCRRKCCTAVSIAWAQYYVMDKKTDSGSHRAVRMTRNSTNLANLRWDQFLVLFQHN